MVAIQKSPGVRSLRTKFLVIVVPLILLSTIIVFGFSELGARKDAERRLQTKLNELIEIHSSVLSEPIWNIASDQIELVLSSIAIDPDVLGVIVYDESNSVLASVGMIAEIERNQYFAQRDIQHISGNDLEKIGTIYLALSDARVQAESRSRLQFLVGLAALLILSVIGVALAANRRLIGLPLERLLHSIDASRNSGERVRVNWQSTDEIGKVVAAYNEMQAGQEAYEVKLHKARDVLEDRVIERTKALEEKTATLEQLSDKLAKYLSPQIYESIFSGKQEVKVASERKKLTVFFSDLAGFTEFSDRLEAEDLTELINSYLTEMSEIAVKHGGTIDKYMGDGIMIFFGDPESLGESEDALKCLEMALDMRKRMLLLADDWRKKGIENPVKLRIGIHTGFCTVGNFGSDKRMDYTIIGGAVNTASRLESEATPGEILISYETFALVSEDIKCKEAGSIEVKGLAYPIATYQVVDSYDNIGKQRQHFEEHHPHIDIDLDLDAMTPSEREAAIEMLNKGIGYLKEKDLGSKTNRNK